MTDVNAVAQQLAALAALKKAELDAQAQANVPETAKAGLAALGLAQAALAATPTVADETAAEDECAVQSLAAFLLQDAPKLTVAITFNGNTAILQF